MVLLDRGEYRNAFLLPAPARRVEDGHPPLRRVAAAVVPVPDAPSDGLRLWRPDDPHVAHARELLHPGCTNLSDNEGDTMLAAGHRKALTGRAVASALSRERPARIAAGGRRGRRSPCLGRCRS